MFYVYGMYDSVLSSEIRVLTVNHLISNIRLTLDKRLTVNFEQIDSIFVDVYDTTDKVTERYSLPDLLNIMSEHNIDIQGINYRFFSGTSKALRKLYYYDSVRILEIEKALVSTDSKSLSSIAKSKMLGVAIDTAGNLAEISPAFVDKDTRVLEIPSVVTTLEYYKIMAKRYPVDYDYLLLHDNIVINDYYTMITLKRFSEGKTVIYDGDITFNIKLIAGTGIRKLYCRGNLEVTGLRELAKKVSDLNKLAREEGYTKSLEYLVATRTPIYKKLKGSAKRLLLSGFEPIVFADSEFIHRVDLKNGVYSKEPNNNHIKL